MAYTLGQRICRELTARRGVAGARNDVLRCVAVYFCPEHEDFLPQPEGAEVVQPNTAMGILAQQKLVSGLFSNTIAMGRGVLGPADKKLNDIPEVKKVYGKLSDLTNEFVQSSPFPQYYHTMLARECTDGECVQYIDWDKKEQSFTYQNFHIKDCYPLRNAAGQVIGMLRVFKWTAEELAEEFGKENCSATVKRALDAFDITTKFEVVHKVGRRTARDSNRRDSKNAAFLSAYVEVGTQKLLRESGIDFMQYVAPRFYVNADGASFSPAMQSLQVMRTVVRAVDDYLTAFEQAMGPFTWLPDKESVEMADREPFGVGFCDMKNGTPVIEKPSTNFTAQAEFLKWMKQEVDELHYNQLFALLSDTGGGQKTILEVTQLMSEKIQAIGPVVNRQLNEYFRPAFEIMALLVAYNGLLEEDLPPELEGAKLEARYSSRLDSQFDAVKIQNLLLCVQEQAAFMQTVRLYPELAASNDVKECLMYISENHHLPPDLTKYGKEYDTILKRFQDEMAAQAEREALAGAVKPVDLQKQAEEGSVAAEEGVLN